jgi:hypothetical protein
MEAPMAKPPVADSIDYIMFSGSKELLDSLQFGNGRFKPEPWDEKTWNENKPVLEEYLTYVRDQIQQKINN